jgi:hypothetical protein
LSAPLGSTAWPSCSATLAQTPWGWEVELLLETSVELVQRWIPLGSVTLEATAEGTLLRGQYERLDRLAVQLLLLECPLVERRPPELRAAFQAIAAQADACAERHTHR